MKNTQKGNLYVAAPANRGDRYGSFLASTALAMRARLFAKATPATFRAITTTAPTAALAPPFGSPSRPFNALWLPIAGFALVGINVSPRRKKKTKLAGFLLCSLLAAGLVFQAACGGGGGGNGGGGGTPPGPYTITITGKSGSLNHSTTVTLKVQRLDPGKRVLINERRRRNALVNACTTAD